MLSQLMRLIFNLLCWMLHTRQLVRSFIHWEAFCCDSLSWRRKEVCQSLKMFRKCSLLLSMETETVFEQTFLSWAPWSSGYGWRLMLRGCGFESWCCILDSHFFTFICCKSWIVWLKRPKINKKEAGVGPFKNVFVFHSELASFALFDSSPLIFSTDKILVLSLGLNPVLLQPLAYSSFEHTWPKVFGLSSDLTTDTPTIY